MRHRLALVIWFLALGRSWGMEVRSCFTPTERCAPAIESEIARAKKEILVAMYTFTSRDFAVALSNAQKRGVSVKVILDMAADQTNEMSQGGFLQQNGVAVRRLTGKVRERPEVKGIMHHKFAVIDRGVVVTGSYNWSRAAETVNGENVLIFRDAGPLADEYRREFDKLWKARR